jgi:dTDP-4-dehydrorhamnose reductase
VDTMLARALDGANELTVVADQTGGPTWTESLAPTLVELAERGTAGLFHVADRGEATWYELAREAFRLAGVDTRVEPVSAREWAAPAPRPAYSVLSVSDAERIVGREFPEWRASLARHVAEVS